jgi:hypothetical protein
MRAMNDITFAMDPTQHHTGYPLPHVVAAQQGYGAPQQYGAPPYRPTPQGLVPPYSPAAHSYGQQYPYQGWPLHAPYFPAPPMAPPYADSGMARPMPAPAPKHKSPATPARAPHTRKSFVNDQREPGGKSALVYVQENHLSDLPFQSGSLRQMLPQARQNMCSRHTVPWSGASSRRKS